MNITQMKCSFKVLLILSFFVNFLWIWHYISVVNNDLAKRTFRNDSYPITSAPNFIVSTGANIHFASNTRNTVNSSNAVKFTPTKNTITTKEIVETSPDRRPACNYPSNRLVGALRIDFNEINQTFLDLTQRYKEEKKPRVVFETENCCPTLSVAIIIPYRDRRLHLEYLLGHLHPILERQLIR